MNDNRPSLADRPVMSPRAREVVRDICNTYAVTWEEIMGDSRNRHAAAARRECYAALYALPGPRRTHAYSLSQIGRFFGRCPSTVSVLVKLSRPMRSPLMSLVDEALASACEGLKATPEDITGRSQRGDHITARRRAIVKLASVRDPQGNAVFSARQISRFVCRNKQYVSAVLRKELGVAPFTWMKAA